MIIPDYITYQFMKDYVYIIDERYKTTTILRGFAHTLWRHLEQCDSFEVLTTKLTEHYNHYSDKQVIATLESVVAQLEEKELILC